MVCKLIINSINRRSYFNYNFLKSYKKKRLIDLLTEYEIQTKTSKKKKCGTHTDENIASTSKTDTKHSSNYCAISPLTTSGVDLSGISSLYYFTKCV
ncbi:unnamed protein product [Pieris brassicae]|uniref:Uncharacterized protein n=1 Tax=Pieris brassicae TaxID=7116 RepID=A0A9P0XCC0_PIEBR|nr:unnamed protein product [Pieris brassicae]